MIYNRVGKVSSDNLNLILAFDPSFKPPLIASIPTKVIFSLSRGITEAPCALNTVTHDDSSQSVSQSSSTQNSSSCLLQHGSSAPDLNRKTFQNLISHKRKLQPYHLPESYTSIPPPCICKFC